MEIGVLMLGPTLACAAAALSFAAPPAHQVRPLTETVAAGARHPPSSSGSAWICSFHGKHAGKMMENDGKWFMDSWKLQRKYGKSWKISKIISQDHGFSLGQNDVKIMSKWMEMVSWYILMPLSKSWIHLNQSWSWSQIWPFQQLLCSHSIKAVPSKVEQWGHKWSPFPMIVEICRNGSM